MSDTEKVSPSVSAGEGGNPDGQNDESNQFEMLLEKCDVVIIHITEFDYDRKLIYGRIVSKR